MDFAPHLQASRKPSVLAVDVVASAILLKCLRMVARYQAIDSQRRVLKLAGRVLLMAFSSSWVEVYDCQLVNFLFAFFCVRRIDC